VVRADVRGIAVLAMPVSALAPLVLAAVAFVVYSVAPWQPSTLLGAQVSLAGGDAPADFVRAAVTTVAAAVVALTVGLHRFRARET
jgi:hypothetical protein